jgi:hypothetical protein
MKLATIHAFNDSAALQKKLDARDDLAAPPDRDAELEAELKAMRLKHTKSEAQMARYQRSIKGMQKDLAAAEVRVWGAEGVLGDHSSGPVSSTRELELGSVPLGLDSSEPSASAGEGGHRAAQGACGRCEGRGGCARDTAGASSSSHAAFPSSNSAVGVTSRVRPGGRVAVRLRRVIHSTF